MQGLTHENLICYSMQILKRELTLADCVGADFHALHARIALVLDGSDVAGLP